MNVNGVFEGGGVKGVGLIGAAHVLSQSGYSFDEVAGTSAGAIVATLLAAGYTTGELKNIILDTNYKNFLQTSFLDKLGLIGKLISIVSNYGIYSADYFENWMNVLLAEKKAAVFGDLKNKKGGARKYRLTLMASDITSRRILVLPNDLDIFGIDPDTFSIAKAVRMSMSIPVFFEPVKLKDREGREHIIVDGGLLSNFPMWVFTDNARPVIGLKFKDSKQDIRERKRDLKPIRNIVDYTKYIVDTMITWRDNQYIKDFKDWDAKNRDVGGIISISPTVKTENKMKDIDATYFDITREEAELLFINGENAAKEALKNSL